MTKKSKSVKSNAWKRVSIDEAKVANIKYSYYGCGYSGYIENNGSLVHVQVIGVRIDLRKQIVKSVLRDADGNLYNREGGYLMYCSPNHYENNNARQGAICSTGEVLGYADPKRLKGCNVINCDVDEEKGTSNTYMEVWIFENGKAENVPVLINVVEYTIDSCWTLTDGSLPERCWKSREMAYYYNEYEVIDEDGEKFTERGIGMRLMPTKEQWAVIHKLTDAFKEAKELGLNFVWDRDNCGNVKAYNGKEIEQYGYDIVEVSCGGMIKLGDIAFADTGINFYDFCGCDSCDELEMKATPRQLKVWKKEHPENS